MSRILHGEPGLYRQGESVRFFNGKENERIPGKREEEHFDKDDRKLEFLQRYGFLMEGTDARAYSAKNKHKKKIIALLSPLWGTAPGRGFFLFPQLDGIVLLSGIWKNRSRGAIIHNTIIINTRNSRLNLCAKPLVIADLPETPELGKRFYIVSIKGAY